MKKERKGSLPKTKFLILLIVASLLCIVPSLFYLTGHIGILRDGMRTVLNPVEQGVLYLRDKVGELGAYFADKNEQNRRIRELEEQLAVMEEQVAQANRSVKENESYMEYLGLKEEHEDFSFIAADVSAYEGTGYQTVYTLNRGSDAGIAPDMPVITTLGLVGYVSKVSRTWCQVVSIADSSSAVGAVAGEGKELAIAVGDLSLREEGKCRLSHLSTDTAVKAGDRVYTAGGSGIYPEGLFIGTVDYVAPDNENMEIYAAVTPGQDPETVRQVMIISSYES